MARYRLVETRFWSDAKVRALSKPQPCGQFLLLRLMTGPETIIIPGVIVTTRAGLAEKMGWDAKGFGKSFAELFRDGWAKADWDAGLIWLPTAIKHNSPANPNVVKGWAKEWPEVPECALKSEILQELREHIERLGKGFAEAFAERFPDGSSNQEQYSGTVFRKQEYLASELASEPTENAHPHSAPTQPLDTAGTLPPTGKAGAALGASSQASKAVSVAKRKPSKRKPSADAIRIAQHLYQAINAHSPDMFGGDSWAATEKRLLGWTLEIDRGLKASDITVEDALLIVDYAHHIDDPAGSNGFSWHTNLLSGVAMRKQWKKKALLGKARRWRDGKGQGQGALGGKQAASDFIENDDYDYAAAAERNRRMGIGI